ncbi:MAG TPA: hypothetical protein VFV34_11330 [Blastocatellia bacterium]|nr:hypothetical protein [Blastocatellia bacterium]
MVFRKQLFPVGLFSLLAFVVALAVATDANAQRRTGGASGTGSVVDLAIRLFDEDAAVIQLQPDGNFQVTTTTGQNFIPCKFTPNGENPTTVDALCKMNTFCPNFKPGTCGKGKGGVVGERISTATCPTGGCTGSIEVYALNNPQGPALEIINLEDISAFSGSQCRNLFTAGALKTGVTGQLRTVCTKNNFETTEPVLTQIVRGPTGTGFSNYFSQTSWFAGLNTDCRSGNFSNSCQNSGVVWIDATPALVPPITAAACEAAASTLKCGQFVDSNNDVQLGPTVAASGGQCQLDSQGGCECKCPKCTVNGQALYAFNPLFPTTAKYAITRIGSGAEGPGAAAACDVTITGN